MKRKMAEVRFEPIWDFERVRSALRGEGAKFADIQELKKAMQSQSDITHSNINEKFPSIWYKNTSFVIPNPIELSHRLFVLKGEYGVCLDCTDGGCRTLYLRSLCKTVTPYKREFGFIQIDYGSKILKSDTNFYKEVVKCRNTYEIYKLLESKKGGTITVVGKIKCNTARIESSHEPLTSSCIKGICLAIVTCFEFSPITTVKCGCKTLLKSCSADVAGKIAIPLGINEIGDEAFIRCSNLTSVVIPKSVTRVGKEAFLGCTNLSSIVIPDGVVSIGEEAFAGCCSLPVTDYIYYADSYLLKVAKKNLSTYIIKEGTKFIGSNAFLKCTDLTSIAIPDSVISIGEKAFSDCTRLKSVMIPNSVKSIGESAFERCSGLISVSIGSGVTHIGSDAFRDCVHLTTVTSPWGVKSVSDHAFSGCSSLVSVNIPNSVTTIGSAAFCGCTSLPVIDKIRYADTYLVEVVDKTKSTYTIKEGTRFVGSYAFLDCSNLTSITIPDSVTSIGNSAFSGCTRLKSVIIPNSVKSIGEGAFYGCSNLTSVTIPNSVTSLGYEAFYHCSNLTSITIPSSVTSIGSSAFSGCSGLTSITIPESVTSIGGGAFSGCSGLTSITIPESVTSIGPFAFMGCNLTSVIIPNNVTSIGSSAFSYCKNLKSIVIPESMKRVFEGVFHGCSRLTSVTCFAKMPPKGLTSEESIDRHDRYYDPSFGKEVAFVTLYVPKSSMFDYKRTDPWKEFGVIAGIDI